MKIRYAQKSDFNFLIEGLEKDRIIEGRSSKDVKAKASDKSDFNAFKSAETVAGIVVSDGAKYSRKVIDDFTDFVKRYKAKGLAWMKAEKGKLNGGIAKFFNDDLQQDMQSELGVKDGDIIFFKFNI